MSPAKRILILIVALALIGGAGVLIYGFISDCPDTENYVSCAVDGDVQKSIAIVGAILFFLWLLTPPDDAYDVDLPDDESNP